ncbi:hypothetical protein SK128_026212, partial [Halocaridina rubra]
MLEYCWCNTKVNKRRKRDFHSRGEPGNQIWRAYQWTSLESLDKVFQRLKVALK